ncbi:MAG TPA: prolyl oligopeptidase family serine peptidase [Tepidisphaeraceae bacterium]|nr:prolyl oligopeptidase family serine peptidase [Tepidisphaeraceae bacterium]
MNLKSRVAAGTARALGAVVVACVAQGAAAVESSTGSVSLGGATLPYRLYEPARVAPGQKVPLVVYLHGIGERGTDNASQGNSAGNLLAHTNSGRYASYVLAPQINTDQWFAGGTNATEAMNLTLSAVHEAMKNENVDTSRVYVTGISMGGMGVWDAIRREPGTFAAAVPVAGGYDPRAAGAMTDVPVWAFHGGADSVVPVDETRAMVDALTGAGGNVKYTEVAGADHAIWDGVYADAGNTLYPWLFAQGGSTEVVAAPVVVPTTPVLDLGNGSGTVVTVSPVPEPSVIGLGVIGLIVGLSRRRAK